MVGAGGELCRSLSTALKMAGLGRTWDRVSGVQTPGGGDDEISGLAEGGSRPFPGPGEEPEALRRGGGSGWSEATRLLPPARRARLWLQRQVLTRSTCDPRPASFINPDVLVPASGGYSPGRGCQVRGTGRVAEGRKARTRRTSPSRPRARLQSRQAGARRRGAARRGDGCTWGGEFRRAAGAGAGAGPGGGAGAEVGPGGGGRGRPGPGG